MKTRVRIEQEIGLIDIEQRKLLTSLNIEKNHDKRLELYNKKSYLDVRCQQLLWVLND